MRNTLAIPKSFTHGDELIVMPRREFERMQKHLIEVKDALAKIRKGEREFRNGQTRVIRSLSECRK